MPACGAKTKSGELCRAPAGPGGLCYFHANPSDAKRLGQIGGIKNRRFTGIDLQIPDNITSTDLCRLEVKVINGLLSGDIPAREVTALSQMFNLLHRHHATAELEKRVASLEEASGFLPAPAATPETRGTGNSADESANSAITISEGVDESKPATSLVNERKLQK